MFRPAQSSGIHTEMSALLSLELIKYEQHCRTEKAVGRFDKVAIRHFVKRNSLNLPHVKLYWYDMYDILSSFNCPELSL